MNKADAMKEMYVILGEHHIDIGKYKLVKTEVTIDSFYNENRTFYAFFESKTTRCKLQFNIEYYLDTDTFGYYNINL